MRLSEFPVGPDPRKWGVRGYASVFGVLDSDGEIVDRGAFSHLQPPIPMFWGHENIFRGPVAQPIGVVFWLAEDQLGLRFMARFSPTLAAMEAIGILSSGAAYDVSWSTGAPITSFIEDGITHISRADIVEITICTWGACPGATCELFELREPSDDIQPVHHSKSDDQGTDVSPDIDTDTLLDVFRSTTNNLPQ